MEHIKEKYNSGVDHLLLYINGSPEYYVLDQDNNELVKTDINALDSNSMAIFKEGLVSSIGNGECTSDLKEGLQAALGGLTLLIESVAGSDLASRLPKEDLQQVLSAGEELDEGIEGATITQVEELSAQAQGTTPSVSASASASAQLSGKA